jgi:dUTP diphosphatase
MKQPLEALKDFDFEEMIERQKELDKKFDEKKTIRERTLKRTYISTFCEMGELFQETKDEWNSYKNSTTPINKERTLEEMADFLHFYLSYFYSEKTLKVGGLSPEEYATTIPDFEDALVIFTKFFETPANKIFGAMLVVCKKVNASKQEFLEVYHKKWLKNWNVRTKEEY